MGTMFIQVYSKKERVKSSLLILERSRIMFNVTDKSRSKALVITKESRTNKG